MRPVVVRAVVLSGAFTVAALAAHSVGVFANPCAAKNPCAPKK